MLSHHEQEVSAYFRAITGSSLKSEAACILRDRLLRSQDNLFTFLKYDGIPWNNNNAEHAIKKFAWYRERSQKSLSQQGLKDYLLHLSICETCGYRGVSFLTFMLSGLRDVETFCEQRQHRRQRPIRVQPYPKGFLSPQLACFRKRFGKSYEGIEGFFDTGDE
jgi:hypothetical protein